MKPLPLTEAERKAVEAVARALGRAPADLEHDVLARREVDPEWQAKAERIARQNEEIAHEQAILDAAEKASIREDLQSRGVLDTELVLSVSRGCTLTRARLDDVEARQVRAAIAAGRVHPQRAEVRTK